MQRWWAIFRALAIAAILPAIALGAVHAIVLKGGPFDLIFYPLGLSVVTIFLAVLLGFPCVLALQWLDLTRWWSTTIAGLLVAGIFAALWSWPPKIPEVIAKSSVPTVTFPEGTILGWPASALWDQYLSGIAVASVMGAWAGYLFWKIRSKQKSSNTSLERTRGR